MPNLYNRRRFRWHAVSAVALSSMLGLGGTLAMAQGASDGSGAGRFSPGTVTLDKLYQMQVSPNRGLLYEGFEPPGGIAGGCPTTVSTWTNADFSGGSFVVQSGFAENEWAAASYVLPASAFPIKIEMAEMIFATSGATQQTTTHWSVGFWSGTPSGGTLVHLSSSDDVILPHLVLPPGTNGANIQFSVDPGDVEQIFIDDDGTHTVSFGYRIDHHNQQTQDPCFVSPPSCCNAFPTTDVSGLQAATNNWLFGVNCGPFGCPANGGWARFSALPGFCRPSGDWVMRLSWSSVNCTPALGACCLASGACISVTQSDCQTQGGAYQGDGSNCGTANCPQPTGACCFESTGGCLNLSSSDCFNAGGQFHGAGTTCGSTVCFPVGACCLTDGSCANNVSPEECDALDGVFQGNTTTCGAITCPLPQGSCCFPTGFCLNLTAADCGQAGGTWGGAGTTCTVPRFTTQPQSQVRCLGQSVTFTSLAIAGCPQTAVTYQWRKHAANIPGATGASYTINSILPNDFDTYDVIATSSGNSTTSATATLSGGGQRCDANCDGEVNNGDIDAFVVALVDGQDEWEQQLQFPNCGFLCACDTNVDGVVDNADIDNFVACLLAP